MLLEVVFGSFDDLETTLRSSPALYYLLLKVKLRALVPETRSIRPPIYCPHLHTIELHIDGSHSSILPTSFDAPNLETIKCYGDYDIPEEDDWFTEIEDIRSRPNRFPKLAEITLIDIPLNLDDEMGYEGLAAVGAELIRAHAASLLRINLLTESHFASNPIFFARAFAPKPYDDPLDIVVPKTLETLSCNVCTRILGDDDEEIDPWDNATIIKYAQRFLR